MTAVSAKALRRGHLPSGKQDEKLLATVAMLKERGIALLSLEERIDTNSAAGELVFHVFGAIAHFERRLIAERTKDGIAAARAKGKHPGRRPLDADKIAAALSLVKAVCHRPRPQNSSGSDDRPSTARSIGPVLNATLPGPGQ